MRPLRRSLLALALCLATSAGAVARPLDPVATVAVGAEPLGLALAADGGVLVVAAAAKALYRIDTAAPGGPAVTARLDLAAEGRLNRILVAPGDGTAYVSASVAGKVLAIAPALDKVAARLAVGAFPQGMAIDGDRLFVADSGDGSVAVVDRRTGAPIARLDGGDRPQTVAVDARAGRLILVKSTTRALWLFDLADNQPAGHWDNPAFVRPVDLALLADGSVLLVDAGAGQVLHLGSDGAIRATIALDDPGCPDCGEFAPMAIALSADASLAAIASRNGALSLIDVATDRLLLSRRVGRDLRGVVFDRAGRLVATSFADDTVIVAEGGRP